MLKFKMDGVSGTQVIVVPGNIIRFRVRALDWMYDDIMCANKP